MRSVLAVALMLVLAISVLTGCEGGPGAGAPTSVARATTTRAPASPAVGGTRAVGSATAPAVVTTTGNSEEVTGIVGVVNASTRTIQIDRRSGAEVTKITVQPTTAIRRASGETATLSDIRPSDRIVARGSLSDRGDALVATEITVSQAVPGAAPAG